MKIVGDKIYRISFFTTSKTIEAFINFHAWMFVIMERTQTHSVVINCNSITIGNLTG